MLGNTCYVLDTAVSIIHAGNFLEYLWWGAGLSFSSTNAELDILDSGCPNAGKQMSPLLCCCHLPVPREQGRSPVGSGSLKLGLIVWPCQN